MTRFDSPNPEMARVVGEILAALGATVRGQPSTIATDAGVVVVQRVVDLIAFVRPDLAAPHAISVQPQEI